MERIMPFRKMILLFAMIVFLSGCATKRYGRLQPVTGYEANACTCESIKIELSKIDAFELQVARESEFSAMSVASFLGDFGIGNVIEKDAALKTAKERRVQLNDLSASKGCK
jgi:hypothetical protein